MEITLDDEHTVVTVNGTKVTDYREGGPVPEKKQKSEPDRGKRAASGYIGVQNHDDKDVVYFKEVSKLKLSVRKGLGLFDSGCPQPTLPAVHEDNRAV